MQISALSTQSDKKSTQDPANMNIKSKAPIPIKLVLISEKNQTPIKAKTKPCIKKLIGIEPNTFI